MFGAEGWKLRGNGEEAAEGFTRGNSEYDIGSAFGLNGLVQARRMGDVRQLGRGAENSVCIRHFHWKTWNQCNEAHQFD